MTTKRKKKKKQHKSSRVPQYIIIIGVLLLVALVLVLKPNNQTQTDVSNNPSVLPEVQLEEVLEAGLPALAFFHSNNCQQCIIMIETVEKVYPEFTNTVELIDIDVYDPNNQPLLKRVGLQYIPTLIFFDKESSAYRFVGVMTPEDLRQQFRIISGVE